MENKYLDREIAKAVFKDMIRNYPAPETSSTADGQKQQELFERLYNEKLAEKKRLEEEAKKSNS